MNNIRTDLSVQELLDCSQVEGNQGCLGGMMDWGFTYVEKNGIATALNYPYVAKTRDCQKNNTERSNINLSYFRDIPRNETRLKLAVGMYLNLYNYLLL